MGSTQVTHFRRHRVTSLSLAVGQILQAGGYCYYFRRTVIFRRLGAENLQTAVVPMWVVYQFLGRGQ
jgi:hypothetical protein